MFHVWSFELGNEHPTVAVPQFQTFNCGIWHSATSYGQTTSFLVWRKRKRCVVVITGNLYALVITGNGSPCRTNFPALNRNTDVMLPPFPYLPGIQCPCTTYTHVFTPADFSTYHSIDSSHKGKEDRIELARKERLVLRGKEEQLGWNAKTLAPPPTAE